VRSEESVDGGRWGGPPGSRVLLPPPHTSLLTRSPHSSLPSVRGFLGHWSPPGRPAPSPQTPLVPRQGGRRRRRRDVLPGVAPRAPLALSRQGPGATRLLSGEGGETLDHLRVKFTARTAPHGLHRLRPGQRRAVRKVDPSRRRRLRSPDAACETRADINKRRDTASKNRSRR